MTRSDDAHATHKPSPGVWRLTYATLAVLALTAMAQAALLVWLL